ncbi:MAG: DUF1289 domain-containing protein [Woeseiaceae bacterium]|nr:DUF1289 domain-containing protein [Woeseiaceae bacterium]
MNPAPNRDGYPASPCISICTLDDEQRCLGCGRTLEQIARWSLMNREEQWAVVETLAAWEPPA